MASLRARARSRWRSFDACNMRSFERLNLAQATHMTLTKDRPRKQSGCPAHPLLTCSSSPEEVKVKIRGVPLVIFMPRRVMLTRAGQKKRCTGTTLFTVKARLDSKYIVNEMLSAAWTTGIAPSPPLGKPRNNARLMEAILAF